MKTRKVARKSRPLAAIESTPSALADIVADDALADLAAQRAYQESMQRHGNDAILMVAEAFVDGMRRQGYKSTARALDELVDNAVQAGAKRIHVVVHCTDDKDHPNAIAIIDDAHGMDGSMIRYAMTWGGSHRAHINDRSGFGRFGFGLPTASISQGRKYTVFSKVPGGDLRSVVFNTKQLNIENGQLIIPDHEPGKMPAWLEAYVDKHLGGLAHGTIVLLEELDKLSPKRTNPLESDLRLHFGLFYRRFIPHLVKIFVNGKAVEKIDPLYLDPDAADYACEDGLVAEPIVAEERVPITRSDGEVDYLTVRVSFMPYGFSSDKESKLMPWLGEDQRKTIKDMEAYARLKSRRFKVLRETAGIIFMRHGRQITVVDLPGRTEGWHEPIYRDTYWGCEIDFPASLDEEFDITTSKQHVTPSSKIWQKLRDRSFNLDRIIYMMRKRREKQATAAKQGENNRPDTAVTKVMHERHEHDKQQNRQRRHLGGDPKRLKSAADRLEQEAKTKAADAGVEPDAVLEKLKSDAVASPYVVRYKELSALGPFYDVDTWGVQKQLIINTSHRFYKDVYVKSGDESKAAMLLLLFVIGEAELDVNSDEPDKLEFYHSERRYWSQQLEGRIEELRRYSNFSAEDAEEEDEEEIA